MAGGKVKRGAAFEDAATAQCPRCDRGLHRACIRGSHCTARQRSPAGCSKRAAERAEKRAARQAKRDVPRRLFVEHAWLPIAGVWIARAIGVDGRYSVSIPVAAFGDRLPPGGEARFTDGLAGDATRVFALPVAAPPADGVIDFSIEVAPTALAGRRLVIAARG